MPYLRGQLNAGEPAELSSGEQVRDYLDVRDAGRMIVEAALGTAQGPVNICSGTPVTIRSLPSALPTNTAAAICCASARARTISSIRPVSSACAPLAGFSADPALG